MQLHMQLNFYVKIVRRQHLCAGGTRAVIYRQSFVSPVINIIDILFL